MKSDSEEAEWAKRILDSIEDYPHHLENYTLKIIETEIETILQVENIPNIDTITPKLHGYRYVGEICGLFRGRHIRWIRTMESNGSIVTNPALTNGGILTDIKFQTNGVSLQCKNTRNQFMQFRLDHCIVFQKLTAEECVWLMCNQKKK